MKMVKKILLGLTAAATLMTFVSCQREEAGTKDMIDVNGGSSKASIDYKNDGDSLARSFKSLNNKHLDAICHIKMTPTELADKNHKTNGVMGFIFNIVKNETTGKYSFTIAGLRYNQETKQVQGYVETFKDVEGDKLNSELPTGIKAEGNKTYADAFGFDLYKTTASSGLPPVDVWIDVVANNGASEGRGAGNAASAGTYTVTFYDADPQRTKGTGDTLTYKNIGTESGKARVLYQGTVKASEVNNKIGDGTNAKLSNMQADLGFYANVQPKENLKGEWKFDAIKMEAEEIEE